MKLFNIVTAVIIAFIVPYVALQNIAPDALSDLEWSLKDRHEVVYVDPVCIDVDGVVDWGCVESM